MLATASILAPWLLAMLAVNQLRLPYAMWWHIAIYLTFFSLLLFVLSRLDRSYRASCKSTTIRLEHDKP
jgi:hypothetical protein